MIWLNIIILALAIIVAVAALVSAAGALLTRSAISNQPYGVGRQESRKTMLVAFLRAGALAIVALILFGVYGLSARPEEILSTDPEPPATFEPEPTSTTPATDVAPTDAAEESPSPSPTATNAPATATLSPTTTPTITPTPVPSAVVNSEVGLYLRPEPGSTVELELLANGAVLTLLDGRETVDDVEWQEVRSAAGNEGWVAVDFIIYQ